MFEAIDEVIKKLLEREIPIKNKEIEIVFEQPTREWSARLNRPTINIFLFDFRENRKLRSSEQWNNIRNNDGTITQRRLPVRIDLRYFITVWTEDTEDQHNLLATILTVLLRHPFLPTDLLSENLKNQPAPLSIQVAQDDILPNPTDIWTVLDNEMRPGVVLNITISLDPHKPIITRMVRTREIRFGQALPPTDQQKLSPEAGLSAYWTIGGTLRTQTPLEDLHLLLVEKDQKLVLDPDGRFSAGHLRSGEYTLDVSAKGQSLKQFKINVPAADLDLEI
jgi:hypothetical protein